jgi:hypothetical protein
MEDSKEETKQSTGPAADTDFEDPATFNKIEGMLKEKGVNYILTTVRVLFLNMLSINLCSLRKRQQRSEAYLLKVEPRPCS